MTRLVKTLLLSSILICSTVIGCQNISQKRYFSEIQPSFFDLRNENLLTNDWLRKPENLIMLHNTFNAFGYWNFLNFYNERFDDDMIIERDIYIKKNPLQLIDSLILTYEDTLIDVKYYNDFWARRRAEKNDSIVYEIAQSIKEAKTRAAQDRITNRKFKGFGNDTLYDLIRIELQQKRLNDTIAQQHFVTLRDYGFHQSAYNLLYERYEYSNVKWDTDALSKTLKEQNEYSRSWFIDNTK